jgi:hypothetical protein
MHHSTLRFAAALGTFICGTAAGTATAVAQTHTIVTIDSPVRISGVVLPPGVYDFRAAPTTSDWIIVRRVEDGSRLLVRAIPATRSHGGSTIDMRPSVVGSVPEMATWYCAGGKSGYAFLNQPGRSAISPTDLASLDDRLLAANDAVRDAKRQMIIAETARNTLRAERARAK